MMFAMFCSCSCDEGCSVAESNSNSSRSKSNHVSLLTDALDPSMNVEQLVLHAVLRNVEVTPSGRVDEKNAPRLAPALETGLDAAWWR